MSRKKLYPIILITLILCYLFWGPLFPWSPIKIGYKKIETQHAKIYIKDFSDQLKLPDLALMLKAEEEFHDLKFKKKFSMVILGRESNMKRYLPWMRGTNYSVKLGMINLIYIGPNARNTQDGLNIYMKHEISHLLIHQNVSSNKKNFEILRQGWLSEGFATYFGGPHYYEKEAFSKLWMSNGYNFESLYEANPLKMTGNTFRLKYTYYRFFIEYLIEAFGIKNLQLYLKKYIQKPEDYKSIFKEVYMLELKEILLGFSNYMKAEEVI